MPVLCVREIAESRLMRSVTTLTLTNSPGGSAALNQPGLVAGFPGARGRRMPFTWNEGQNNVISRGKAPALIGKRLGVPITHTNIEGISGRLTNKGSDQSE